MSLIKKVILYIILVLLLVALAVYVFNTMVVAPDINTAVNTAAPDVAPHYTDYVVIRHTYYTSYFSKDEHIPLVVTFKLTADMVQCSEEEHQHRGKFSEDPEQPELTNLNDDYRRSGFDRGHNMSAADNECNEQGMRECFYFSNMTPQPHSFNAGKWEDLEKQERREARTYGQIIVTVGSTGLQQQIGADQVEVPEHMWKVIYIPGSRIYQCYLFPDSDGVEQPLWQYKVPLETIETQAPVVFEDGQVKLR